MVAICRDAVPMAFDRAAHCQQSEPKLLIFAEGEVSAKTAAINQSFASQHRLRRHGIGTEEDRPGIEYALGLVQPPHVGALRIDDFGPAMSHHTEIVSVERRNARSQCPGQQTIVRVEKDNVGRGGDAQPNITGGRDTGVWLSHHPGKAAFLDNRRRIVG